MNATIALMSANGNIGLFMLLGIAVFIVLLALRTRKMNQEVAQFYLQHSLFAAKDAPPLARAAIGVKGNLLCLQGTLKPNSGGGVTFYWWEWFSRSTIIVNNVPQSTLSCFLAVSFPPHAVSEAFEQKAVASLQSHQSFGTKLKAAFSLDTTNPYRAEKLDDGSFIIFWRVVQNAKVLEDKIIWLQNNVSLRL